MNARTDWKALAKARGLDIPEADVEAIAPRLDSLEQALRRPALELTPDQEPATTFRADAESE